MSDEGYRVEAHAEGVAFVAFGNWLFAIEPRTGRRLWYVSTSEGVTQYVPRLAVVGDRVVAVVGQTVTCAAVMTGAVIWRAKSPIHSSAFVVTSGVALLGGNGETAGIDLETGQLLWHDPFKNLGVGPTTIAAGDVVSGPIPAGRGYG